MKRFYLKEFDFVLVIAQSEDCWIDLMGDAMEEADINLFWIVAWF